MASCAARAAASSSERNGRSRSMRASRARSSRAPSMSAQPTVAPRGPQPPQFLRNGLGETLARLAHEGHCLREDDRHHRTQLLGLLLGRSLDVHAVHRGDRQVHCELDRVVRPRNALGSLHLLGELAESPLDLIWISEEIAEAASFHLSIVLRGQLPLRSRPVTTVASQVEYESSVRFRWAIVAFAAALLLIVSQLIQLSGAQPPVSEATVTLITENSRATVDIIGAILEMGGLFTVAALLYWLHRIAQARQPGLRGASRW